MNNLNIKIGFGLLAVASAVLATVFIKKADPRTAIVENALSQLGEGNAAKYWTAVLPVGSSHPKEWCGGFALWALKQAGLAKDWTWEVGKGFLYKLPQTKSPKPGDIAYFEKNQHQAVVKAVNDDGTIALINGNSTGGKVLESTVPKSSVYAFFSVEPLLPV